MDEINDEYAMWPFKLKLKFGDLNSTVVYVLFTVLIRLNFFFISPFLSVTFNSWRLNTTGCKSFKSPWMNSSFTGDRARCPQKHPILAIDICIGWFVYSDKFSFFHNKLISQAAVFYVVSYLYLLPPLSPLLYFHKSSKQWWLWSRLGIAIRI